MRAERQAGETKCAGAVADALGTRFAHDDAGGTHRTAVLGDDAAGHAGAAHPRPAREARHTVGGADRVGTCHIGACAATSCCRVTFLRCDIQVAMPERRVVVEGQLDVSARGAKRSGLSMRRRIRDRLHLDRSVSRHTAGDEATIVAYLGRALNHLVADAVIGHAHRAPAHVHSAARNRLAVSGIDHAPDQDAAVVRACATEGAGEGSRGGQCEIGGDACPGCTHFERAHYRVHAERVETRVLESEVVRAGHHVADRVAATRIAACREAGHPGAGDRDQFHLCASERLSGEAVAHRARDDDLRVARREREQCKHGSPSDRISSADGAHACPGEMWTCCFYVSGARDVPT